MKKISKFYGATQVLKSVDLEVNKGEIHALLGENGAGKSTLMNILFGMGVIHETGGFEGEVHFEDRKIDIKTPADAMSYGIGMVHQEFMLLPQFSVCENIKLNREPLKGNAALPDQLKLLDLKTMEKEAKASCDSIGLDIDQWAPVAGMPVGYMQFIEIARELDKTGVKLLVFDEPTAVLAEAEAAVLLKTMRQIADQGIGILFITHRLDEVVEVADTVTILRDGELVGKLSKDEIEVREMARLMVGREVERIVKNEHKEKGKTVLSIKNLRVNMPGERVKHLDLEVKEGEILGIGGLGGHGKVGVANGIMGIYPAEGDVTFNGEKFELNDTFNAYKAGLSMVSEDRRGIGLLLDDSIADNIAMTAMHINGRFLTGFGPFSFVDRTAIQEEADEYIKNLDIRCTGRAQHTRRLSGGNQQKVCIARALAMEPKLLFVSEPTRGIDIGAKRLVLQTLIRLNREAGLTIVMASSELAELRSTCDRIVIMNEGIKAGELAPDASDADFGLMMAGQKVEGAE